MILLWYLMLWLVWTMAFLEHQSLISTWSNDSAEIEEERPLLVGRSGSLQGWEICWKRELAEHQSLYSTCTFLSCFPSDDINKNDFRVLFPCLLLEFIYHQKSKSTTGIFQQKGFFVWLFVWFIVHIGTREILFITWISLSCNCWYFSIHRPCGSWRNTSCGILSVSCMNGSDLGIYLCTMRSVGHLR